MSKVHQYMGGWSDSCGTAQIKVDLIFIIPEGQFVVVQPAASTKERDEAEEDHWECWCHLAATLSLAFYVYENQQ